MKFFRCETGSIISNGIQETSDEHVLPIRGNDRVGVGHVADGETLRPVLHLPRCIELAVSTRNGEGGVAVSHYLALLTDVGEVHAVVDPARSVRSQLQSQRIIEMWQDWALRQTLRPHLHPLGLKLE